MTNAEKFVEVFGTDLKRQYSTKTWWDQEFIEQEPCDAVSRKAAIDACLKGLNRKEMVANIKALPSVHPECTEDYCPAAFKPVDCEDYISRQDAVNACRNGWGYDDETIEHIVGNILGLPSVTSAEKVGRWEWVQYDSNPNIGNWHCSECNRIVCGAITAVNPVYSYKYCPECGAKMQENES